MGKTLVFAVFDFDRFTKNDEIGEVRVEKQDESLIKAIASNSCCGQKLG